MIAFVFVSFSIFVIYLLGVPQTVFGGDSGDIILASWFGGVAHPPGYPLNTIIGWVFTHLPYSATVAYKANLMAAVMQALVVGILFLILKILTKNTIISLSAALTLAFTPLFWLYAHVAEVFQLNLVLVGASVLCLLKWRQLVIEKKTKRSVRGELKFLYLTFVFYGLAVFHHQTAILIAPAIIYLIYHTDKKIVTVKTALKLCGFFLVGLLPYLFIPIAALRQTPINWGDASTPLNFIRLITRADYGTFLASKSFAGSLARERLLQIVSYLYFVKTDFSIVGILFMTIGALYLFFKEKIVFWSLTLAIFLSGPFFLAYASFALASDFLLSVWERFILLSYFFLAILVAFGFLAVYQFIGSDKIQKRFKLIKFKKEILRLTILVTFFLLPLTFLLINWPKTDLSDFRLGDWLGHDVLASSEPDSIIFLFDDTLVFNTQYVYYTSGEFKNRRIVVGGILRHPYYRRQLVLTYKDLNIPENFLDKKAESGAFMADLIKSNSQKFPIYTFGFAPNIEGKTWAPSGLLSILVNKDQAKESGYVKETIERGFSKSELNQNNVPVAYTQLVPGHIKLIYYGAYVSAGDVLFGVGLDDDALLFYRKALAFASDQVSAFVGQGRVFLKQKQCGEARTSFSKAFDLNKHSVAALEGLLKVAKECDQDGNAVLKYEELLNAERQKSEPTF